MSRNGRSRTVLFVLLFLFLPPLLSCTWSIARAALTYDGICPGIMDIEPYVCTLGEFVERNTISPFALAAHLLFTGGWLILASVLLLGLAFGRYLRRRMAKL